MIFIEYFFDSIDHESFEQPYFNKTSDHGSESRRSNAKNNTNKIKNGSTNEINRKCRESPFDNKYGVDLRLCKLKKIIILFQLNN